MKIKFLNTIAILLGVVLVFSSCEKDDPIRLENQMDTWEVKNVTSTSAELSGIVVAGENNAKYGVCWSTAETPTIADSKVTVTSLEKSVYWVKAENLEHLTKYYARAYTITANDDVTYGAVTSFTTLANIPYIGIGEAIDVKGKSATIAGNLTADGKSEVSEKGIVYSKTENPELGGEGVITMPYTDAEIGAYTLMLENLEGNTTYYVRAYATNKVGTAYTNQITFTTNVASPTIATVKTENITKTTVDVYGSVTVNGGSNITERGFCWGKTENPEVGATNKKMADKAEVGDYNLTIDGLESGEVYFIRAYAINAKGTAYGDNIEIKTIADIQKLYVPGGYQVASGYGDKDWNPETAPFIVNTKADRVLQGYVYFASATEFKFTSDLDWDHTNYGVGSEGKLDTNGGNLSVSEAGYYLLKVDLSDLSYSATKMDWRLIGGAVGGWDDAHEVDMVYNKKLQRLVATANFVDGEFKMRANRSWDYNFGDNDTDGSLESGGANIPITAGIYTFMANLSERNYTGVLTQWGLIGDATGSWSDDIDMVANLTNNTWTFTGDLKAGAVKFRANDGWDINLGGDINNLTFGGANISIDADGNYTIVLDLVNNTCSITKN